MADGNEEQRVGPLELFFDLVFVFAITQVTAMMADDPTWGGLGRGLLVLAAVWWAWAAYAWLTNFIDTERGGARLTMFAAMAAMLLVSLAVPGAFGEDALLFGIAYFAVRALHIVLYALSADDVDIKGAIRGLAWSSFAGTGLILLASAFDGTLQGALWCVALALDYAGPAIRGTSGWRIAAGHFAERFALIIIIALGESIVAIGAGAPELSGLVIVAAVLGTIVAAAMWWAYFDVVALVAERRLAALSGDEQIRMARDAYAYLHVVMVAGIVLGALGFKKALAHVEDPLETVPAVALCGGVALYLIGHIAFRLRNVHSLNRPRAVAAATCLALIPVATAVPALVALAAVAAVVSLEVGYQVVHYREARARVRAARTPAAPA
jgi:low temperature requirement protein LtrA